MLSAPVLPPPPFFSCCAFFLLFSPLSPETTGPFLTYTHTQNKPEQSTESDVLVCKYKTLTSCLVLVGFIMAGGGGKSNRSQRASHNPVITHSPSKYLFLAQSEMKQKVNILS